MSEIFTTAALERYNLPELRKLFHDALMDIAASDEGSAEHHAAQANIESIRRAIAGRTAGVPTP